MKLVIALTAYLLLHLPQVAAAGEYPLDRSGPVIGKVGEHRVTRGESLHEIARANDLGYNEITSANPGIDPFVPPEDSDVTIPAMWILPDAPREGIVLNQAEMRLYQYREIGGKRYVITYPVGVGADGQIMPTGKYSITMKLEDPAWYVPASIRMERPGIPPVIPPGGDNPLGRYAMTLSASGFLIHGTNAPFSVGRRVSNGCIRLYPEDIEPLVLETEKGTQVVVVYQPIKIGLRGGMVYVEVHEDYLKKIKDPFGFSVRLLEKSRLKGKTDLKRLKTALERKTGVPTLISH